MCEGILMTDNSKCFYTFFGYSSCCRIIYSIVSCMSRKEFKLNLTYPVLLPITPSKSPPDNQPEQQWPSVKIQDRSYRGLKELKTTMLQFHLSGKAKIYKKRWEYVAGEGQNTSCVCLCVCVNVTLNHSVLVMAMQPGLILPQSG